MPASRRSRAARWRRSEETPKPCPDALPPDPGEKTRGTMFPVGPDWELTPVHVWRWFFHRFECRASDPRFLCTVPALDADELLLLKFDLDCYQDLCERHLRDPGRWPRPAPLPEYLRESRENWGEISAWLREDAEREGSSQ
jgi:hypothetical protein